MHAWDNVTANSALRHTWTTPTSSRRRAIVAEAVAPRAKKSENAWTNTFAVKRFAGLSSRPWNFEGGAVNFCRRFASFESEHARISPVKDVFRPY
eukprot:30828-Pelagococcus_subviridis.AAC.20